MANSYHVVGTQEDRSLKASNILALLQQARAPKGCLLDIGTGTGWIANGMAAKGGYEVVSVDVADHRQIFDLYEFRLYSGDVLPAEDDKFDVVVCNHVLEHVGPRARQLSFLVEVKRVLKVGGIAYLACPSKWQPIEPHFRILGLSLLPRSIAGFLTGLKGKEFDVWNVGPIELDRVLNTVGLSHQSIAWQAARLFMGARPTSYVRGIESVFRLITPTHVRILQKT